MGGLSRRSVLGNAGLLAGMALFPAARSLASSADAESWPKVAALLDSYVQAGKLPGALAGFGWGTGPLHSLSRGTEGYDDTDPIGPESLFRIYSMTKPITGMAAMALIDDGAMALDQPLAEIMPEFSHMQVALDPAKSLDARPATVPITIRHLLTHTAGFGYAGITQNKVGEALLDQGVTPAIASRLKIPGLTPVVPTPDTAEFLRRAAAIPLVAEPGSAWHYSMSLDILGLAMQRVSGAKSFAAFLEERIFAPAGMTRTWFQVPRSETGHLTTNYGHMDGSLKPIDPGASSIYLDPTPFAYGGTGLVSTPADYDRFLQMLIGGGMVGGTRVLSPHAVELGMSNLLPPGANTAGTTIAGAGFGAGGRVGLGDDAGTFGWSGAAGTIGFVNRRIGLRAGFYAQFMPFHSYPIQQEFMAAALADVAAQRKAA